MDLMPGRTINLNPAMTRVGFLRTSAGQNVERFVYMVFQLDAAISMLMREPVGRDEIGYEDVANLITVFASLSTGSQTSPDQKTPLGF
jgi:hypothetical protein